MELYNQTAYALGSNRSCIRELFEYGRKRAAQVGADKVYDFSIGNPSLPAPPQIEQTIRELLTECDSVSLHGYTSAIGDEACRRAIAQDLNDRFSCGARAEDLFMGCGAAPELVAVFRALAVENAEFLAIAPYFPEYKVFVEGVGARLTVVPPDIPDFQIDLKAVQALLTPNTRAVIINSPNNPSGVVYTEKTLKKLADLLIARSAEYGHPIYIVADEPYRELAYGGVQVPFIPNLYANTLVCYSYSKSLSLPGERIGYVYVPQQAEFAQELYAAIAGAARAGGHVCAPSLWQKVLARCAHLRPDLTVYDQNRQTLYTALRGMGYELARPDGAFYLFVKAPGGDAKAFSEKAKELGLLLVPGDDFGCPGYFRMSYCVDPAMIQRSLPVFEKLVKG